MNSRMKPPFCTGELDTTPPLHLGKGTKCGVIKRNTYLLLYYTWKEDCRKPASVRPVTVSEYKQQMGKSYSSTRSRTQIRETITNSTGWLARSHGIQSGGGGEGILSSSSEWQPEIKGTLTTDKGLAFSESRDWLAWQTTGGGRGGMVSSWDDSHMAV